MIRTGSWAQPLAQFHRSAKGQKDEIQESAGATVAPKILVVEDNLRYAIELLKAFKIANVGEKHSKIDVDLLPDAAGIEKYLSDDQIDVYVIDLGLTSPQNPTEIDAEVGRQLVQKILENSRAGVIVHSSLPAEIEAPPLLDIGADDYIEKPASFRLLRSKILAVWRRVQQSQPSSSRSFAHTSRVFLFGGYRFVVGNRELKDPQGKNIKITATEHAILRYLCTVEDHEISREVFNIEVLGREVLEKNARVDNFIYKLRHKLGSSVQLISKKDGGYKLLDVIEVTDVDTT
jgi:DNA-binding response OmpR family regulator